MRFSMVCYAGLPSVAMRQVEGLLTSPRSSARHHFSATDVERFFLAAEPWPAERSLSHLLEGCPVCSERATDLWSRRVPPALPTTCESSEDEPSETAFAEMYARVAPRVRTAQSGLAAERAEARRLLLRLLAHPPQRQLVVVGNSRRHHTWGLCELLLDEAWSNRFKDPRRTESLARLAVAVSAELPEERYGRELTIDLRARCLIALANGQRILGTFPEAVSGFEEARKLLDSGTGDVLEKAYWHDMRASLRSSMSEFRAAEHEVGLAARIYYEAGERHALGNALVKRAAITEELAEVERSIVLGRAGVELVDPALDLSVLLVGWLNLTRSLHSLGRHRDALAALARARPAYVQSGDRTTFLRFQWLEGSVAGALGRFEQAEGCLLETRDGFLELGIVLDAAVVCLDLALVLGQQGRNAEVIELASEMISIFEAHGARVDALSALILLRRAAERKRLDEVFLRRLRSRLREARS